MRTRPPSRIAVAALLAVATGGTLTGSVTTASADAAHTGPAAASAGALSLAAPLPVPQLLPQAGRDAREPTSGTRTARDTAQQTQTGETGSDRATGTDRAEATRPARTGFRQLPAALRPFWFTPAFQRRLLASGTEGVRLPDGARLPGGVRVPQAVGLAQTGIRPGQWLLTLLGSDGTNTTLGWCSANFVFRGEGRWGLGTAGHCAPVGQLVSAFVVPPVGSGQLPGLYVIGRMVVSHNNGIGDDFGMIEIFPEFASWMNPTMPVWGGPSGVYRGNDVGLPVTHFGHGTVVGTGGTPRAGVSLRWDISGGDAFSWASPSTQGDSGSGVLTLDGRAAGNLTHIAVDVAGNIIGVAGTRMPKILEIAPGWRLANGSALPIG